MATATVKIEMAEQKEKRKAKEARQLERLIKERNRPKKRWYYAYFILIIAIVYIVDEVASQIGIRGQQQKQLARLGTGIERNLFERI